MAKNPATTEISIAEMILSIRLEVAFTLMIGLLSSRASQVRIIGTARVKNETIIPKRFALQPKSGMAYMRSQLAKIREIEAITNNL